MVATKGEEQKGIYRVYRMDGSVMPQNSSHRGARPTEEAHASSPRHARLYDSGAQGQARSGARVCNFFVKRRTPLMIEAHASSCILHGFVVLFCCFVGNGCKIE